MNSRISCKIFGSKDILIKSVIHVGNGNPEYRVHYHQRFSISNFYVIAGEDLRKAVKPLKGK